MTNFINTVLTVLFIFSCSASIMASDSGGNLPESFSNNKADFVRQLGEFMSASNQKEVIAIYEEFKSKFNKGAFDTDEEVTIIETSNQMLDHKMTAKPYFCDYLKGLNIMDRSSQGKVNFTEWHDVLHDMLGAMDSSKKSTYKKYLIFSVELFEGKKLTDINTKMVWETVYDTYSLRYVAGEPQIYIEKANLVCTRKDKSIIITETKGSYLPLEAKWKGSGGTVQWRGEGLGDVYCELKDYELDVKKGLYKVNEVILHHPQLFPGTPVAGSFEDKITTGKETSYPRFTSSSKSLKINTLGKGIEYIGGVKMHGNTIYGVGTKEEKAQMIISNKNNKQVIKCAAEQFKVVQGKSLSGEGLDATMMLGNETIYHPSSNIKFDMEKQELSLQRGKRGKDRNPFFSTFHNMNIDVDRIDWNIQSDSISLGKKAVSFMDNNKRVNFESLNYYNQADYLRFQNAADNHPISLMKIICDKENTRQLDANDLARKLNPKFSIENIKTLIYDLVEQGFIYYDKDTEIVTVNDKIFHYANAAQDKIDYDNLRITSLSDKTNAVIDLETNHMLINGVKQFEFNKEHKIAAVPKDKKVTVKDNRNLEFDGKLFAGFGIYEGKGYHFDYDTYSIQMDSVRFMDIYLPNGEKDKNGDDVAMSLGSRIEYASGTLILEAPSNKSAKENMSVFPSFNSSKESYVYYNDKNILGGCYSRDNFFFALNPFNLNGMDGDLSDVMSFDGTMKSAKIFPDFKETLVLQEDQSLGFTHQSPTAGYAAYDKKGHFKGEVNLSNKGFLAKGNVSYLWASIDSDDITLKPEQMLTSAQEFNITEDRSSGVQVPQVKGYDVAIDWRPYKDSMYVASREKPFELFKADGYTLEKTMILTPEGLKGRGIFDSNRGRMSSNLYSFGAFSVQSDTANLQIKATGVDHLALDTKNVYAMLDFDAQIGNVKANVDTISTTLPYNQYETSMNEFDWNMSEETLDFKNKDDHFGTFLSLVKEQENLAFLGKTAFYDLKTSELRVGGIPYIETADAYIHPDNETIEIQKGGIITTLENAQIIANTKNKYHVFNRATVDIVGKKEYRGSGYYEYNIDGKEQEIFFENIGGNRVGKGKSSEKKVETRGVSLVDASSGFQIGKNIFYNGKVNINANVANLTFKGFAKMKTAAQPNSKWFTIECEADKNNLILPIEGTKSFEGEPLAASILVNKETGKIYTPVLTPKLSVKDRVIFDATKFMKFDANQDAFVFGDSISVVSAKQGGNRLEMNSADGKLLATGTFEMGPTLKSINSKTVGQAQLVDGKMKFDMMAAINMALPEKLINFISSDFMNSSSNAPNANYKPTDFYEKAIVNFIPNFNDAMSTISKIKQDNYIQLPAREDEKYPLFVFGKIPLQWETDYNSFVNAEGKKLALSSVNGKNFNKLVEAYVEFKKVSEEDQRMYIYVKSPSDYYYFFSLRDGILGTTSSNMKYNEMVTGLNKKENIIKNKNGESIEIQLLENDTAKQFKARIQVVKQD